MGFFCPIGMTSIRQQCFRVYWHTNRHFIWSHGISFEFLSSCFFSDFVPIDLDEWWAQRFLANIDKLSWHFWDVRILTDRQARPEAGWLAEERRPGLEVWWVKMPWCGSNGWTALGRLHRNHRESLHLNSSLFDYNRSLNIVCDRLHTWGRPSWSWGFSPLSALTIEMSCYLQ